MLTKSSLLLVRDLADFSNGLRGRPNGLNEVLSVDHSSTTGLKSYFLSGPKDTHTYFFATAGTNPSVRATIHDDIQIARGDASTDIRAMGEFRDFASA